ncbi:uncharacterized protein N7503_006541 [Penicillium pulvis]|uniref:uncharacterized protein n=1 Tax=Penicillium pulvis TaxID=1562058 RepID=UPI002549129C|nr:uncharacterized protein N7503_006541 [Penicillium pulvis]KAJ5799036.1 hypothetical protein N7503_006541 [Penicillium pulvis]
MYDGRLVGFKSRSASSFPVERLVDNGFNSFPITLRGRPSHPGGKIIHKGNCSSLAVDLSLHEVCVKEKKENRRQGRALRQSSLWQALSLR